VTSFSAKFEFTATNLVDNLWTYTDSVTIDSVSSDYTVEAIGGIHVGYDSSDPYLLDDRGLWFDGKYDFLLLKNLQIEMDFVYSLWIKPHGSGTLYSVSRLNDPGEENFFAFGLKGRKFNIKKTSTQVDWTTSEDVFTYYSW
jgi:hypothetical protein